MCLTEEPDTLSSSCLQLRVFAFTFLTLLFCISAHLSYQSEKITRWGYTHQSFPRTQNVEGQTITATFLRATATAQVPGQLIVLGMRRRTFHYPDRQRDNPCLFIYRITGRSELQYNSAVCQECSKAIPDIKWSLFKFLKLSRWQTSIKCSLWCGR